MNRIQEFISPGRHCQKGAFTICWNRYTHILIKQENTIRYLKKKVILNLSTINKANICQSSEVSKSNASYPEPDISDRK